MQLGIASLVSGVASQSLAGLYMGESRGELTVVSAREVEKAHVGSHYITVELQQTSCMHDSPSAPATCRLSGGWPKSR